MFKANGFKLDAVAFLVGSGLIGLCSAVQAAPTRLLLESDTDAPAGSELSPGELQALIEFMQAMSRDRPSR